MKLSKGNYNSIDLFKFLCSFLVIGIHTQPFSQSNTLDLVFGLLTRIAVPFFFVTSSFFFYLKSNINFKKLYIFTKRLFSIYLIWSLFYLLLYIPKDITSINLHAYFKNFLIDFFITGYKHLWFLHALIISSVICFILIKYITNQKLLFSIGILLLCIGLCFSTYYNLFTPFHIVSEIYNSNFFKVIQTRNGIFYAPIYIIIGRYFAINYNIKHSIKKSILGVISSFILLSLESVFCIFILKTSSTILWLSVVPLVYYTFNLVLSINLKYNSLYILLRKLSILIYTLHPSIIVLIEKLNNNNFVLFISVSFLTLIISNILYYLSLNPKLKYIKILY